MLYCPVCRKLHEIVRYHRDNPILDCGHEKLPTSESVDKCRDDIDIQLSVISLLLGTSVESLRSDLVDALIKSST